MEEILAAVGGEAELREDGQQHLLPGGTPHELERRLQVVLRIADAHERRADAQAHEAMAVGIEKVLHPAILPHASYGAISHIWS